MTLVVWGRAASLPEFGRALQRLRRCERSAQAAWRARTTGARAGAREGPRKGPPPAPRPPPPAPRSPPAPRGIGTGERLQLVFPASKLSLLSFHFSCWPCPFKLLDFVSLFSPLLSLFWVSRAASATLSYSWDTSTTKASRLPQPDPLLPSSVFVTESCL